MIFTKNFLLKVACKAIHSEHVSNSAKVLELVKREIEVLQKL